MKASNDIGHIAEDLAARYLEQKGYNVIKRRFRSRQGEIDLVVRDGSTFVFVEVKYRRNLKNGRPAEAVDHNKRRRLILTALYYLQQSCQIDAPCRFDVVELWQEQGNVKVHHHRDAFDSSGI